MANRSRSEIVDDIKGLFDRLEDEVEELAGEGKEGVQSASNRAQQTIESGKIQSKEKIETIREQLDDLEDELEEKVGQGKEKTADTIKELRGKLKELETRLRD